jgi:RNA polymerase primary sigma factor
MEHNFYEMYLEEMELIAPLGDGEKEALLEKTAAGEVEARKRLIEGSLSRALAIAKEYEGRELPMSDLVQEANTALTLAAVEYDGSREWEELMESRIREAIELALEEQKTEADIEENVAARVNVLQTVSQVLAKELGREATVEELAAKMKMTEDEIKDIMKIALDALTINDEGKAAGSDSGESGEDPMKDGWEIDG